MLESLTYAAWSAHVNDTFRIHPAAAPGVAVALARVTDQSKGDASGGQAGGETFSLVFQGPLDRVLAQGTYEFEHEDIGTFPLFIVPIGVMDGRVHYEAVFNRLPP